MRDIAISVACYNNEKEVLEFARKVSNLDDSERIQLLITCNSCNDYESFQKEIKQILKSALVYDPRANLGYLQGCLYGIRKSKDTYTWVVICNTDIEFQQHDFFDLAISGIQDNVWCVGPDIILTATGIHQNPFLKSKPSRRRVLTWKIVYSSYPLYYLYVKLHKNKVKKIKNKASSLHSEIVYAVHGSFFILRMDCVQKIIEEKPDIFMYCEELLVAEIIRENGKSCYFNNKISILHNENQVTGKIGSKRKQQWLKKSIRYLAKRFIS